MQPTQSQLAASSAFEPNSQRLNDRAPLSVNPPDNLHSSRQTDSTHALSDEERERHIKHCGELMEMAMVRWYETGDFGHRGEADRWRILMEQAIKGRSAEQVARMEQERGLA